jgi:hypothetical protein
LKRRRLNFLSSNQQVVFMWWLWPAQKKLNAAAVILSEAGLQARELLFQSSMQATLPLRSPTIFPRPLKAKTSLQPAASCAIDEINSYLGVRDLLLGAAEEVTTESNLHRAWMANEFAENCLRPARSPYQGQCLLEGAAVRERQRCKTVKMRIAELRARIAGRHFAHCRAA